MGRTTNDSWYVLARRGLISIPAVGFILSFLYGIGFIDVPASKGSVSAIDSRLQIVEGRQANIMADVQSIHNDTASQNQKLDDVKVNVDRLVGALIDGGASANRHR